MSEDRLNELKQKYVSVLNVLNKNDFKVQNIHVQNDKLFIRAEAPTEEAKNRLWDQVKTVDPQYKDFSADITVAPQQAKVAAATQQSTGSMGQAPQVAQVAYQPDAARTYTVQKGDTLSAIAKQMYGNAGQYMKIYNSNRDQLNDPDKIYPGQVLKIPE